MRASLVVLAFALAATTLAFAAPPAEAMTWCVDHSPDPAAVPDCGYYLACVGSYCVDYPCRYCVPI
jgi:hypothetical protein